MQKNSATTIQVNKIKIAFSKKKMTAYGKLSLMASLFKQIRLRDAIESIIPVQERSPNSMGVYGCKFGEIYSWGGRGCLNQNGWRRP